MNNTFTYTMYIISVFLILASLKADKDKTKASLKKALKMFLSVMPKFLAILFIVSAIMAVVNEKTIQNIIGSASGFSGMIISSLLGSFTLVPVVIAFPIAADLLRSGAGLMQITVFICTLTSVGIVTLPLEGTYLGRKAALLRNILFMYFHL